MLYFTRNKIRFLTKPFKHEVVCYRKEDNRYDVYLNYCCIKLSADKDWIENFKKLLT